VSKAGTTPCVCGCVSKHVLYCIVLVALNGGGNKHFVARKLSRKYNKFNRFPSFK
jgi:hypothetical protein